MYMIDLLSLPGVAHARSGVLDACDAADWLIDDLIRAVAEEVEKKLETDRSKKEDEIREFLSGCYGP